MQYLYEGGQRVTELTAAVVTAERIAPIKSQYYLEADNRLTEEELERRFINDIVVLLQQFPGVRAERVRDAIYISIRNSIYPPLLLVDEIPVDNEYLDQMSPRNIAQIDILKNPDKTAIFGMRGLGGVVSIYTKRGINMSETSPSFHFKMVSPLGFQQPVEFYAPKYDTPEKRDALSPDLRTTIHWQPFVQVDNQGMASFEFYTADENTSYTVIIEGLANNGQIIRKEAKLWKK